MFDIDNVVWVLLCSILWAGVCQEVDLNPNKFIYLWYEVLAINQMVNKNYKINATYDIKAEIINNNKHIL